MKRAQRELEEKRFAEEVSLVLEESGTPRMAGRILGWLLVSDEPHNTLNELAEALQASKGSISTMTRLLIQHGLIERVPLPGERKDYLRIRPGGWTVLLTERMRTITAFRQLLERALELTEGKDEAIRQPIIELVEMYKFFEREFPALLERWEQSREKSGH